MTNNPTIDGVSRDTIQRIADRLSKAQMFKESTELRALLDVPAVEPANELREHCKQCAEAVNNWPDWKQNCLGSAPAVERQEPKASQVPVLRAMAANYRNGHSWDFLDGDAVSKASDEITAQASTIARLEARVTQLESEKEFAAATYQAARDRIAELESGRGEPACYQARHSAEEPWFFTDKPGYWEWRPLFTAPPAPVAVVHPFAEKVIRKLQRVQECAEDGQDTDIGRHWLDLLTQLGLLNRLQRSPARWEITQQGEDCLDATAALNKSP